MKKMPTQLLKYLVKECTKEVLDQLIAEQKLKGKAVVKEEEQPNGASGLAVAPTEKPEVPEPEPEEPKTDTPEPASKGPVLINPRDKSRLEPIRFSGRDDASIERTLHHTATKVAGSRTKVSLGAKRLARQAAAGMAIFFYIGKIDPESDELFLMADKSEQIAKDESVQPSEIQGVPAAQPNVQTNEPPTDDAIPQDDPHHFQFMTGKVRPKPRYGIDEETQKIIKKAVNKILDRR